MLFSNMGFTLASHYCRGQLVKTELVHGTANKGCCLAKMEQAAPKDCKSPSMQQPVDKKGCCQNTYQNLDIDDDFSAKQVLAKANTQLISVFIYVYFQLNRFQAETDNNTFSYYSPPLLEQDAQVLYQTFLL